MRSLYQLKVGQETIWSVIVAVLGAVLQVVQSTDPTTVTNWKTYAVALGVAISRAAIAAIYNVVGPRTAGGS